MVGTPVNPTLGRQRQEACHEFQVKSVFHSKSPTQRKYKGGGRTENHYAERSTGLQGTDFAEKGNEGWGLVTCATVLL